MWPWKKSSPESKLTDKAVSTLIFEARVIGATTSVEQLARECAANSTQVAQLLEDGHTPHSIAALYVANACFVELESGRHHMYRNVLNLNGRAIKGLFYHATDQLVKHGKMTPAELAVWNDQLSGAIKHVG